ncbi:phage tail-collar fiber domain-containing protein [Lentibacillus sp. Marseille-P4043]|uniref:phage tail-collar fiber domain-containing protein n=1 Tax=Lentibacillus sp. Marseille-P4043 TaxID=2040293 RepID=UPI001F2124AE|nr:phage tail protein [Lentibacillus sp. Marseille-P4043]
MSTFGGIVLTNKGKNLQSKAQAGVTLEYTRIGVGDGNLGSTSILSLNYLVNEIKSLSIVKLKALEGGKSVVGTVLSNQDLTQGFYFREVGVYAADPDLGEILYCYGNAGELAEYISPGGGTDIIEKSIDIHTSVGNTQNVTAVIDSSLVYATQSDIERIELRLSNHENKKGQSNGYASLDEKGNVPESQLGNLPDNLETTTGAQEKADAAKQGANNYTDTKISEIDYPVDSVNNKTGDVTLSAADVGAETPSGAQAKANAVQESLNNHKGDTTNPHNVTKAQVGLSNVGNVQQASRTEFYEHQEDGVRHITAAERRKWNGKQDALTVEQRRPIYIQSTAPENPQEGDIWIEVE